MNNADPRRTGAHLDAILDGRPTRDPLGNLVAVLQAPAQPHELTGLDAALSVFGQGPSAASAPEVAPPMSKAWAGRALVVKVLALIAGAAATGGVAYAATAGNSSAPHHPAVVAGTDSAGPSSSASDTSAPASSVPGSSSTPVSSGLASGPASGSASTGTTRSGIARHAAASPSPSLAGLCTAWLAHPRDVAKLSTNPAFSVLINAAGGADAVNGYCATLLATSHPTHPAQPTQARSASHTHPAQPTQARNTSHPTHPSRPAHPSQAHNSSHPHPHPHP